MKGAVLMVVVLAACSERVAGERGPQGETGYQGVDGRRGPAGPSIIWKNPAGVTIAYGEPPKYRDSDGNWWFVETDVGQVDQLKQPDGRIGFSSTDCTGPSYYLGPVLGALQARPPFYPPRLPFFVAAANEWRVRNDNARVQTVDIQSNAQPNNGCSASADGLHPVIPTGAAYSHQVALPDLGSTGPLRMETYQD